MLNGLTLRAKFVGNNTVHVDVHDSRKEIHYSLEWQFASSDKELVTNDVSEENLDKEVEAND